MRGISRSIKLPFSIPNWGWMIPLLTAILIVLSYFGSEWQAVKRRLQLDVPLFSISSL